MKTIIYSIALLGSVFCTSQLKGQVVLEALEAQKPIHPFVQNFTPSERCLELVYDKHYGDGDHDFIYCAVRSYNGRKWLTLNLGAEYAKESSPHFKPDANIIDNQDWKAFGSLFQEGRKADGHELVTYSVRDIATTSPQLLNSGYSGNYWYAERKYPVTEIKQDPLNSNQSFVFVSQLERWMTDRSNEENLWAGDKLNNPCPNGYRIMDSDDLRNILDQINPGRVFGSNTFQTTTFFSH